MANMSDFALSERAPMRVLSWLLATPLALLLLIHPGAMLDSQGRYSHSLLMLVMALLLLLLMALISVLFGQFGMPALAAVPGWPGTACTATASRCWY